MVRLGLQECSGLTAAMVRRIVVATSWLRLMSPWMPVMFATSMRQASRPCGPIHRATTESGPS